MNLFAFSFDLSSLVTILICLIAFVAIRDKYKSRAKTIFILMLISVALRLFGNLLQAIFTEIDQEIIASIGIYIGMLSALLVFFFIVVFLNLVLGEHRFKAPAIHASIALIFSTLVCTINPNNYSTIYDASIGSFIGKGDLIHTILLILSALVTTAVFLVFLIKQLNIVEKKYHKSVSLMIIGNIFMGILLLIVYVIRYVVFPIPSLLHLENLFLGIGIIFLTLGFIGGGQIALLGSSKIFYVSIFYKCGLSVYHGIYAGKKEVDEQLLSALATAVTSFGNVVIGEDVFPTEINFKDFAVLLYRHGDVIGFISCKYPSRQLRFGLKNIVEAYHEKMTKDEVSGLLELNLPYGKPIVIK
ncbi:MAG: hypothetical protein ACTSSB_14295 [Candidatus Heimdallarchaeota archaeon]